MAAGQGEVVSRTARTLVVRTQREGRQVIVKAPAAEVPAAAELARYRHEFALLKLIEGDGVVRAIELVEHAGRLELILEDIGGKSLAGLIRDAPLPLERAVAILKRTAEVLARIHEAGVVHKDVNPANLVWSEKAGALQLIDFSISSRLAREQASAGAPEELEGTLSYLAPEQSGRMTRGVDHRADLYALGATAWHLLVGRPPFTSADPLGLLHAHLAQIPKPPRALRSDIPESLSAIVERLLAKDPDHRYQSGHGLAADLARCLEGRPFILGADDRPATFAIPERLYGRAREQAALLEAFDAARTRVRTALVRGRSGMGKSSLVASLRAPIIERGGAFATGRFEMLRRDTPYLAIVTALGSLIKDLLAGSAREVAAWREKLGTALGPNRGVIRVPGLDQLIGESAAPAMAPEEARNRSRVAFAALLRALASDRPLLLFLDDLQWADTASDELIAFIAADPDLRNVLLVLGFRDDEVAAEHLLHHLEGLEVDPGPLSLRDLSELVADTCRATREAAEPLAALLLEKTAGNAFFARATLERLHRDRLIVPSEKGWTWDLDAIRAVAPAENVVALMVRSLRELSDRSQDVLRKAACIGQRFEGSVVAGVIGRPAREVAADLWPPLERGLVVPEGAAYRLAEHEAGGMAWYRFAHDRVQEAAVSLLPEAERPAVHLAIGRVLGGRHEDPNASFAVAAHLAEGLPEMRDPAERMRFAELALTVGRRARSTAAFETAFGLFEAGLSALGGWERAPELARALSEASADSALLAGDLVKMEQRIDEVLARSPGPLEQLAAITIRARSRMARNDMKGAFEIAAALFDAAGMPVPTTGGVVLIASDMLRLRAALGSKTPEDLRSLPVSNDPLLIGLHELRSLIPAAHVSLYPQAIPRAILGDARLTFESGVTTGLDGWNWVSYGMFLAQLGDVDLGIRFADLALFLCEKAGRFDAVPRIRFMDLLYIRAWRFSSVALTDALEKNAHRAIEVGDLHYASRSAIAAVGILYGAGTELARVTVRIDELRRLFAHHGLVEADQSIGSVSAALQILRASEPVARPRLPSASFEDTLAEGFAVTIELHLAMIFGDEARALELAERGFELLDTPAATVQALFYWTYALAALLPKRAPGRRERKGLAKLKRWVRGAPDTRGYRLVWIEALEHVRKGHLEKAVKSFDRAIDQARESGQRQDAALIAEQAARYLEGGEYKRAARAYRQEAWAGYRQWGATAKVAEMEARYPELAVAEGFAASASASTTGRGGSLDLETVLRAAQALTGEIRLDVLVERLMGLALENAGAERGALLLPRGGRWMLVSISGGAGVSIKTPAQKTDIGQRPVPVDLDSTELFPATILRSVIRSKKPLVLSDGKREWTAPDPYVAAHAPQSVLCLPLLDRDELSGLLYLENNLATGAFTPERLEVLRAVSGLMAVSLRAAELHGETLDLKRSFERFVPKDFLENLRRASVAEVRLGDSVQKEMTVLFTDMRGFTSHVEGMSPEENIEFINQYLGRMEPPILAHGGFVDSYIGDAIMALFDRGEDALSAAIEMLRELRRYNAERAARGRAPVSIGAGVNTGLLTLGTIGGENRIKCGVIGDSVNLAARVESLTKSYQVPLLTTGQTRATLPTDNRFSMRAIDRVRVVGRTEPVTLYEVYDADDERVREAKRSTSERWEEALAAYYSRRFEDASALFAECAFMQDPVVTRFIERARRHAAAPPGPEWTGVEILEHK